MPSPGTCNGTALRKAARHVSLLYDAALAPLDLRGTQRAILVHVARLGAPGMGDLAAALVLDRSALAHMIKPLVARKLLSVERDPADGRGRIVRLTQAGTALLAASAPLWQTAQTRFEQAFGPAKAARLRALLAEIAALDLSLTR
ncbi:MAG: winged helix-turn-helix transcriptional regulator [Rhodospirillales bacterium]|nr:winged helix-turn-helix transcriptional regulator [Rhodospirillales bacterium]